jgi:hypothetical protein
MTTRRLTSTNANELDASGTLSSLKPFRGLATTAPRLVGAVVLAIGISMSSVAYAYAPTKALIQMSPKEYAKAQLPISQYKCLEELYTRESNWRQAAYNPSGAYGIPQLKNKLIQHMSGIDQVRYGIKYIRHRYKTPCIALQHMHSKGWH